jgi:hypothetical protein
MSTIRDVNGNSSGVIEALDGFSDISIVNNSDYDIDLNDIKVGTDFEGKVTITDASPMIYTPEKVKDLVVKEYTRSNGKVYEKVLNDGNGRESFAEVTGNAVYKPLDGLRYTWVTGERFVDQESILYCSKSFWGIDWLAKDPGDIKTYTREALQKTPLLEGEYVEYVPNEARSYTFLQEPTITLSGRELVHRENWSEEYPWYKFKANKYYTYVIYQTGTKDVKRHSIEADAGIGINFIGNEDVGTFSVNSKNGGVNFNKGFGNESTNIAVDAESVSCAPSVVLCGKEITLNSSSGIGSAENPLGVETKEGGAIHITSLKGDVNLIKDNGDFMLGDVNVPEGNTVITADGDIKQYDTSKSILSKGIDFTSRITTSHISITPLNSVTSR